MSCISTCATPLRMLAGEYHYVPSGLLKQTAGQTGLMQPRRSAVLRKGGSTTDLTTGVWAGRDDAERMDVRGERHACKK